MKKFFKFLFFLFGIIAILLMALYFFQEKLIFLSEKLPQDYEYTFETPFEEFNLGAEDGATLNALHFKAENPRGIIVYFHGNAGNLSKWGEIAPQFTVYNYDVLLVDYRGYGKSTGKRTEKAMYRDALMVYDKAKSLYPENKIIVFGRSLGTTFAAYAVSKNKPRKLILESPFYSLEHLVAQRYPILPVRKLLKYKFNTGAFIEYISCPITIIHGTEDGVVPYEFGQKLFSIIPEKQRMFLKIENGKHNDLSRFQEYLFALRKELAY